MEAGKLRHRITIQTKVIGQDTFGAETENWTVVATVWASIEPMRGQEFLESQRLGADVDTRMRLRFRPGIGPQMRVIHGTHVYDVKAVIAVEERKHEMQLMCREVIT